MGPKGVVTSAVLAVSVAAVGLAGPAFATDEITQNAIGTYEFEDEDVTATWSASPCEANSNQCIRVTQLADAERNNPLWSANAYWQVGSWIMFVDEPDALTCEDGTKHNQRVSYSWDAAANTGWRSYTADGVCDGNPSSFAGPFTLTETGPPPPSPGEVPPPPLAADEPVPAPEVPPPASAEVPPPASAEVPAPGPAEVPPLASAE